MANERRITDDTFSSITGPELVPPVTPLRFLSDVKADISRVWKATLEAEEYGRRSYLNGQYIQSVTDEIDSLLDALRQQCFYRQSPTDKQHRRSFLADYASPYYSADTLRKSILPTDSFVPRIIKAQSMLYKEPASRWLVGNGDEESKESVVYADVARKAEIHAKAKEWLRGLKLHGCVLVRPVVRPRGKTFRLEYDYITPDSFRVLVNSLGELENVVYTGTALIDSLTQDVLYVWTNEGHYMRDVDGKQHPVEGNDGMKNPYGFIPFVLMRLEEGDVYDGAAVDLVDQNLYTNYLELQENTDATFAAVNAFLHTNLGLSQNEVIGPRRVLGANNVLQGDGNAVQPDGKFVSGDSNGIILRDLKTSKERQAAQRAGIPAFMLSENPTELSGKAMKIASTELLEARQDDAAAMERNERALYGLTARVSNWHGSHGQKCADGVLPEDDSVFRIDFAEIGFDDDPVAAYDLAMRKVEDGIISIVQVARDDNPDIEEDKDLLEMIAKNKRELTAFKARGFRAALLNAPTKEPAPPDNAQNANAIATGGNV